jgi:hypothetical protein
MSDEHKPTLSGEPTFNSPNFRIIYANGFSYKPSVTEFALTALVQLPFGQNVGGNIVTTNANMQEVMVMMSLAGVKSLAKNLSLIVNEIEKIIGPIKLPRESILNEAQLGSIAGMLKATSLIT